MADPSYPAERMRKTTLGELDVVLAGGPDRNGGGDGPMLVLMHGFGAPGNDLVPFDFAGEQPEPHPGVLKDQRQAGFPITLLFPDTKVTGAEADLRIGGADGTPVEVLVSSPEKPANSKQPTNFKSICVIPVNQLKPSTTYTVRVRYKWNGEDAVRRLVDRFYDLMDGPDAVELRALHPRDLSRSRDKLTWYLTGWLGGPPRYTDRYGHPRLRARHLPFTIGGRERDQWMACMRTALAEQVADPQLRQFLDGALQRLADHMINQ